MEQRQPHQLRLARMHASPFSVLVKPVGLPSLIDALAAET